MSVAEGTFTVAEFTPVDWSAEVTVGLPVGHAHMVKQFEGGIIGRSITQFSYAYDPERGGTYVATESFEGEVDGRRGAFAFVHSATTVQGVRGHEFFLIVPGSGTGELAGISGTGQVAVEDDGTHRLVLDFEWG